MLPICRAVIDIGTNSVKLLVAEVKGTQVQTLWEESEQTRLGQGFYESHRLQSGAIAHTSRSVARLAGKARELGALSIRAIATSAAREAVNQSELLDSVLSVAGVSVDVISGEQEADWAYTGVRSDPELAGRRLLILDVGGGSTEFMLGHSDAPDFRRSFALGTVRLHERFRPGDPPLPQDWENCRSYVHSVLRESVMPAIEPWLGTGESTPLQLVGTGGTTSILAAMELQLTAFDRDRIDRMILTAARIHEFQQRLWALRLAERKMIPGLPANRADVILFGIAIYGEILDLFGLNELRISVRGLRHAAVLQA